MGRYLTLISERCLPCHWHSIDSRSDTTFYDLLAWQSIMLAPVFVVHHLVTRHLCQSCNLSFRISMTFATRPVRHRRHRLHTIVIIRLSMFPRFVYSPRPGSHYTVHSSVSSCVAKLACDLAGPGIIWSSGLSNVFVWPFSGRSETSIDCYDLVSGGFELGYSVREDLSRGCDWQNELLDTGSGWSKLTRLDGRVV